MAGINLMTGMIPTNLDVSKRHANEFMESLRIILKRFSKDDGRLPMSVLVLFGDRPKRLLGLLQRSAISYCGGNPRRIGCKNGVVVTWSEQLGDSPPEVLHRGGSFLYLRFKVRSASFAVLAVCLPSTPQSMEAHMSEIYATHDCYGPLNAVAGRLGRCADLLANMCCSRFHSDGKRQCWPTCVDDSSRHSLFGILSADDSTLCLRTRRQYAELNVEACSESDTGLTQPFSQEISPPVWMTAVTFNMQCNLPGKSIHLIDWLRRLVQSTDHGLCAIMLQEPVRPQPSLANHTERWALQLLESRWVAEGGMMWFNRRGYPILAILISPRMAKLVRASKAYFSQELSVLRVLLVLDIAGQQVSVELANVYINPSKPAKKVEVNVMRLNADFRELRLPKDNVISWGVGDNFDSYLESDSDKEFAPDVKVIAGDFNNHAVRDQTLMMHLCWATSCRSLPRLCPTLCTRGSRGLDLIITSDKALRLQPMQIRKGLMKSDHSAVERRVLLLENPSI